MESFVTSWVLLISIFFVALASPGPDFVVAVRNSIVHSRLSGIMTALGFAGGVAVHVTLALIGIAAIIASSVLLFSILKYIGAAYLFYMGIQALRSKGFDDEQVRSKNFKKTIKDLGVIKSFMSGFITNVFNPKATMFFLAIFSQFVRPEVSFATQLLFASTCVVMTFLWFSFVSVILTHPPIKRSFIKMTKWLDRICGMLLISLGIKLALSKAVS